MDRNAASTVRVIYRQFDALLVLLSVRREREASHLRQAHLGVLDPTGGAGVLTLHPDSAGALLHVPRLIGLCRSPPPTPTQPKRQLDKLSAWDVSSAAYTTAYKPGNTMNRPGESGDSICWESWGHGKIVEELSG